MKRIISIALVIAMATALFAGGCSETSMTQRENQRQPQKLL